MEIESRKIATDVDMPAVSLAADAYPRRDVQGGVKTWLDFGGRGIATSMFNELVGNSIHDFAVKYRKDLFLTAKVPTCDHEQVVEHLTEVLNALDTDYIDLLLLSNKPVNGSCTLAWAEMEKLLSTKQARAIGVVDFQKLHLKALLENSTVTPHVNQLDFHVLQESYNHFETIEFCDENSITLQSYSPFGGSKFQENPVIKKIADSHKVSSYQVAIKWILQHGWSLTYNAISQNIGISDADVSSFELTDDEMYELDGLNAFHSEKPQINTKAIAAGVEMPLISLGCDAMYCGDMRNELMRWLEIGESGVDVTPRCLGQVGRTLQLRAGEVDRDELFLTAKIECNADAFDQNFQNILDNLKTSYVDLLLLERGASIDCIRDAWIKMEKLFLSKQIKSMGVRDYHVPAMKELLQEAKIKPHVNQISLNIFQTDAELIDLSAEHSIHLHTYAPVGDSQNVTIISESLTENPSVQRISYNRGVSPEKVAMKWILQNGWSLTLKTNKFDIGEADLSGFNLSYDDMKVLNRVSGITREKVRVPTKIISPGVEMPVISIGCENHSNRNNIVSWFELGGRGFEALQTRQLAAALKDQEKKYDRKDIFLTVGVSCGRKDSVLYEIERALNLLNTDYIDLLLLENDSTDKDCDVAWKNVQDAFVSDQARTLGVKGFDKDSLEVLLKNSPEVKPAINQVDFNIFKTDSELIEFMSGEDILFHSYSPIGSSTNTTENLKVLSEHPTVYEISQKHGVFPYQIAMKWIVQHGGLLTFNSDDFRASDVRLSDFELTAKEMASLDGLTDFDIGSSYIKNKSCTGLHCMGAITILVVVGILLSFVLLFRRRLFQKKNVVRAEELMKFRSDSLYKEFPSSKFRDNPLKKQQPPEGVVFPDFPRKSPSDAVGEKDLMPGFRYPNKGKVQMSPATQLT